jgi:PhnB protein
MNVSPYMDFDGRCEQAIEFYKGAVGAEVQMLMRYKDMPGGCAEGKIPPGTENKVMHASLRMGDSLVMMSDGHCRGELKIKGACLSLSVESDAKAEKVFKALSDGGKVTMPLGKTFFASSFGMVDDRFGVPWMVVAQPENASR